MRQHTCIICKKEFKAARAVRKYCSYTCMGLDRQIKFMKSCVTCGKQFLGQKHNSKYCSMKCMGVDRSKQPIICKKCGKKFRAQGTKRKYCSNACYYSVDRHTGRQNEVIKKGYRLIYCPNHPNCDIKGYYPEHRLIIENSIGRILFWEEIVHHINHNKLDNRIENLKIMNRGAHKWLHVRESTPPLIYKFFCKQCGKECSTPKKNSKFCSRSCSIKHRNIEWHRKMGHTMHSDLNQP